MKLPFVSLTVLLVSMVACTSGIRVDKKISAEPSSPGKLLDVSADLVAMTAWTVPANDFTVGEAGNVQVSLIPLIAMDDATLRIISHNQNLRIIGPASFIFSNMKNEQFTPTTKKNLPPNPPALGMTTLRNFEVVALKAGRYVVRVEFSSGEERQFHDVAVNAR